MTSRLRTALEGAWSVYLAGLRIVCASLMVWMVGVTLVNVVMRYLLSRPIAWADESARLAFIVFTFLAASLAAASGSHLVIDSLAVRLPAAGQRLVRAFIIVATVAFCAILLIGGIPVARVNLAQASPALRVPLGWVYAAVPVSAVLILVSTAGAALFGSSEADGDDAEPEAVA